MSDYNAKYMRQALSLARLGRTSPNPKVGAVVVRDGKFVSGGFHTKAGEPHAEIVALRKAGKLAQGADLYVTLEPCCHHGKTPPCADAVIRSGIKRVFAAMEDPNEKVSGKGFEILRQAGIEVHAGMLESEAKELNFGYIKRVTVGFPYVFWKAAMTLDGKIATRTGDSRWVTGESARMEVHKLRSRYDAVMVGIGTVLADDPELTVRDIMGTVNPKRIVIDGNASIPLNARVLNSEADTILVVKRDAPEEKISALWDAGVKILGVRDIGGRIDLRYLMSELGKLGINSILLEGGGEIAASMIEEKLIDKGLIFISPKIIGGRDAKTPVEGEGIELMNDAISVSIPKIRQFGDDIALEVLMSKE